MFPASDPFVTGVGGTTLGVERQRRPRSWSRVGARPRSGVAYDADGKPIGYNQAPPGIFYAGGRWWCFGTVPAAELPARRGAGRPLAGVRRPKMRVEPDIAADADPYTGYLIGYTGRAVAYSVRSPYGGTSLATPAIAALVEHRLAGPLDADRLREPAAVRRRTVRATVYDVVADPCAGRHGVHRRRTRCRVLRLVPDHDRPRHQPAQRGRVTTPSPASGHRVTAPS